MKLVLLLYLEDDESLVDSLLADAEVTAFSRMPLEGHGQGQPGWYGEITPYRSKMIFAVVHPDRAQFLLDRLHKLQVQDERHPIHAIQVGVESCVCSGGVEPPYFKES